MLKLATVFSGIGAIEEAVRQLGIEHEIVFASDNNEFVRQSYFANHKIDPNHWHQDVRFIDGENYSQQVTLFVGGSPCQSFSTYGKRMGLSDIRGTLFYDYARLVNEIKPQVFIFENVTGLLSHDDGKTWEIVKQVFEDLDYDIKYDVLDAKDYGIPQLRRRLFVIGIRKDIPHLEYAFPEKIKLEKKATDYLDATVDNKYYLSNKGFAYVTQKKRHEGRARVNRDVIGCQTANQQFNWTGDFRIESPKVEHINDAKIHKGVLDGEQVVARKLTPAECLRLMGFQDFKTVVVDEQIYRQAGNSICVPVLKEILKQINNSVRIF